MIFSGDIDMLLTVENEALMTKKDVMAYLRISHDTLHRLMKSGTFPYIKLERRVLFRRSEIEAFLESKTMGKRPAKGKRTV